MLKSADNILFFRIERKWNKQVFIMMSGVMFFFSFLYVIQTYEVNEIKGHTKFSMAIFQYKYPKDSTGCYQFHLLNQVINIKVNTRFSFEIKNT